MLLEYHDSKAAARHQLPRRSAAGWVCRSGNSTLLAEGIESAPDGCSRTAVSYASSRLRVESAVCTYFLLTFCMWTNCTTGATCCTMTAAAAPPPGPRPNMHTTHAEGTLASRWNPRVLCRWPIAKSYAAQLHTGPMARPALTTGPSGRGPGVVVNFRASVRKVYLRFKSCQGTICTYRGGSCGLYHGVLFTANPCACCHGHGNCSEGRHFPRADVRLQLPILVHPPARTPGSTVARLET
jgi:hypothetical protein